MTALWNFPGGISSLLRAGPGKMLKSGYFTELGAWRDAESIVGGETYVCFLKSLQNNRPMLVLYEVSRLSEWTSGSAKGYGLPDAVSGAPTMIAYPRQML